MKATFCQHNINNRVRRSLPGVGGRPSGLFSLCFCSHLDTTTGKLRASSCGMVSGSPTSGSRKAFNSRSFSAILRSRSRGTCDANARPKTAARSSARCRTTERSRPAACQHSTGGAVVLVIFTILQAAPQGQAEHVFHETSPAVCLTSTPVCAGHHRHVDHFAHRSCCSQFMLRWGLPAAVAQATTASSSCPVSCLSSLSDRALPASYRSRASSSWAAAAVDPGLYTCNTPTQHTHQTHMHNAKLRQEHHLCCMIHNEGSLSRRVDVRAG